MSSSSSSTSAAAITSVGSSGGTGGGAGSPAPFVKAEANLLRFPFFALKTKGLKAVTGYECKGKLARDGVVYKFTYKTSRNVDMTYPGALSRSVHLAFLNLLSEQGTPLANPISWTWRDLCRRMGISCSGRAINDLKQAILATRGVIIISDQALYSKPDGKPICTQKEAVGLYERVVFLGADLPDGEGLADKNYLWLSQWYLDNLNALFTAPLNHELWLHLEQRSSIASRLYEFLLLNFHATPILRINYEKLATFLPIRVEKHLSQAKQQLNSSLELLVDAEVLESFEWQKGKSNQVQLQFTRGRHCGAPLDPDDRIDLDIAVDGDFSNIEVKEKRLPPEYLIVDEFNRQWQRSIHAEPSAKEMAVARELLEKHGATKLKLLIPIVVKKLKAKWPDAKSFSSVTRYMSEAEQALEREQIKGEESRQAIAAVAATIAATVPSEAASAVAASTFGASAGVASIGLALANTMPTLAPRASRPSSASSKSVASSSSVVTSAMARRRQEDAAIESRNDALKRRWASLPAALRREIEDKVNTENPTLRSHPLFLEAIRLEEMVKRGLAPGDH